MTDRQHHRVHSQWAASAEELRSGFSPSGSTPVLPFSYHSFEMDLGISTPTTGEQLCSQQGSENHREKRRPCSISTGSSGHNNSHTPIKGIMASTLWGKMWLSFIPKPVLTPKILDTYSLCDPMNWSLPGSFVHRILQARILEWVSIPFSRGCSLPRDQTYVSHVSCIVGGFFTV